MKIPVLLISAFGFVVLVSYLSFSVWRGLEGVNIGPHGLIALLLGVFLTVILGCGLMYLLFYSSRKGHDDLVD